VIGDRRGALIDDRANGDDTPTDGQHAAPPTRVASLERAVAGASSATDKLEQVVNFIGRLLQMKLDVGSLNDDAKDLIEMAQRHSRGERWDDVLELARALAMLLALLERWEELLQSLQLSIHAAEQLGDVAAEAWGHHELGTVHLLRGDHAKADSSLAVARKLRERIGDWDGLAATDFNLQVLCRWLRAGLHNGWHLGGPLVTLGLAVLMLVVGGAAGVAIGHTGWLKQTSDHPASVGIELNPDTPGSIRILSATPNPVPAGAEASKIAVKVLNQEGEPISGQPITFTVKPRDGAPSPPSAHSDSDGIADTTLSLTGSRTSTVKDTVEACATARACDIVGLEWEPQTTPAVVTLAASAVTATGATLNGTLNPNDTAIESCHFQYGIGSYEHSARCSPQRTEGASPTHVSASHLSLTPNTVYSFRLVAGNASGQSSGEPQAFKTKGETTGPTGPTGTTEPTGTESATRAP
jgi:hypothetical protein